MNKEWSVRLKDGQIITSTPGSQLRLRDNAVLHISERQEDGKFRERLFSPNEWCEAVLE